MRFVVAYAAILATALFVFSNDQARAVPDFRDGWVDQGGAWHPFPPRGSSNGAAGQPAGGSSSGAGGDTHDGDNQPGNSLGSFGDGSSGDSGAPASGAGGAPTGGAGGSDDSGLAGLNGSFNDLRLDNGPDGGTGGGSDAGGHGSSGGTQYGDAGGSSVDPGGSHFTVPEPASIVLLAGALVAAGAARRRARTK